MKTLYLECNMGAAGDMLMAALLELHPDPAGFVKRMNGLGIPGVVLSAETAVKCGITGTHVSVTVNGEEEESHDHHHVHDGEGHHHDHGQGDHCHEHGEEQHHHEAKMHHHHEHDGAHSHEGHHHSGLHEIEYIIGHLHLPEAVAGDVMAVYILIAEAESRAHGRPVSEIHFHEVGAMDAIADIVGVCLLINELKAEQVLASPVHVGSGQVRCAHGILPVPAPATAHILQGIPSYGGSVQGELCTPTGAALLKHFVKDFGPQPPMAVEKIGYGMGKKDFEAANCVRAFLGETAEAGGDRVLELSANLDDMTPEAVAFAVEQLFEAGALDAFTTPIVMKKGRPATMLTVLCREGDRETLVKAMFKHSTTLGIREQRCSRYVLERREISRETPLGDVSVKCASGYGVRREKPEFEDLARLARAHKLSLQELRDQIKMS